MKKAILCICFLSLISCVHSQINVSLEDDCVFSNSAIISKAMISTFGEDSVKLWLEKNVYFSFYTEVDSLGYVHNINRIFAKERVANSWVRKMISNEFNDKIEIFLIKNNYRFYFCYMDDAENLSQQNFKDIIIKEIREYFRTNKTINQSFAFPGELMHRYELEQESQNGKLKKISKYDCLIKMINKYSP